MIGGNIQFANPEFFWLLLLLPVAAILMRRPTEVALDWITGDAMALPFEDNSFDVYTISFGIRNVTRIPDALSEAYRVLRPGGRARYPHQPRRSRYRQPRGLHRPATQLP